MTLLKAVKRNGTRLKTLQFGNLDDYGINGFTHLAQVLKDDTGLHVLQVYDSHGKPCKEEDIKHLDLGFEDE